MRSNDLLLKFQGIDSREDARSLSGSVIWVERHFAAPLARNEFYASDLKGCDVYHEGSVVGRVVAVYDASGLNLVEILLKEGTTVLLPFNHHFFGEVVIKRKMIVVRDEGVSSWTSQS